MGFGWRLAEVLCVHSVLILRIGLQGKIVRGVGIRSVSATNAIPPPPIKKSYCNDIERSLAIGAVAIVVMDIVTSGQKKVMHVIVALVPPPQSNARLNADFSLRLCVILTNITEKTKSVTGCLFVLMCICRPAHATDSNVTNITNGTASVISTSVYHHGPTFGMLAFLVVTFFLALLVMAMVDGCRKSLDSDPAVTPPPNCEGTEEAEATAARQREADRSIKAENDRVLATAAAAAAAAAKEARKAEAEAAARREANRLAMAAAAKAAEEARKAEAEAVAAAARREVNRLAAAKAAEEARQAEAEAAAAAGRREVNRLAAAKAAEEAQLLEEERALARRAVELIEEERRQEAAAAAETAVMARQFAEYMEGKSIDFNGYSWDIDDREQNREILKGIAAIMMLHETVMLEINGVQKGTTGYLGIQRFADTFPDDPGPKATEAGKGRRAYTAHGRVLSCKSVLIDMGIESARMTVSASIGEMRQVQFIARGRIYK